MAIGGLPLFDALKARMSWHHARQKVLAENVSNADTPGFRPMDVKPPAQATMRPQGQTVDAPPAPSKSAKADSFAALEALATKGSAVQQTEARHQGKLNPKLFAAFDWDRIYLVLLNFKLQRSWSNLRLDMDKLKTFVSLLAARRDAVARRRGWGPRTVRAAASESACARLAG
jgi:flagellar basal body rod protein FlgB